MADTLFERYRKKATAAGIQLQTNNSREWFRDKLSNLRDINRRTLLKDPALSKKNRLYPGRMYMYFYDPKTKDQLPYYDRFPLVVMVEPAKDGFYGINLHYLPPALRAKMLGALMDITNNDKYDQTTKFKLTYGLLTSSAKLKWFKPCFKKYLYEHIDTIPALVGPEEWEVAVFLPTEMFKKEKKNKVWRDSRKMI